MFKVLLAGLILLGPMASYADDSAPSDDASEVAEAVEIEEAPPIYPYAPEHCEFGIEFPEEAYIQERCEGDNDDRCYDVASFTRVHDMISTVNFRVICNPVGKEVYDTYSAEIMEATLRAMTKNTLVKTHNSDYREGEGYKQASLVGEGKAGKTDMIYIAQMWIGQKSAFTLEAELIGSAHEAADKLFSDILRSVKPQEEKASPAP